MPLHHRALLVLSLLSVAGPAIAQQAATPVRIRGTIDAIGPTTMQVTDRDGDKQSLDLAANLGITEILPAKLSEVKPGTYIGTAALPGPNGTLRALELQVFPNSMRGVGEGSHPFDLQPQSSMTNATVTQVVGTGDKTLTVRYKGGEKTVLVPDNVPVITYAPGDRAMLAPGAHVIVSAMKDAQGDLTAQRVSVGKDGLVPPM